MKEVKIVFSALKIDDIQEFASIDELKEYVDKDLGKYNHQINVYIKDKQRFKPFDKHVEKYFYQRQRQDNSVIEIEYKFKDIHREAELRVKFLRQQGEQLIQNFNNKLELTEEGQLNLLRKVTKRISLQESEYKKTIHLTYFIFDALVKKDKSNDFKIIEKDKKNEKIQKLVKLHTKDFNFKEHEKIIGDAHASNYEINLIVEKKYFNHKSIEEVMKFQHVQKTLNVLQIFTSIVEENGIYYALIEDDDKIGLQSMIKLQTLFAKLSTIKDLYFVIMIGYGVEKIQKIMTKIEKKIPLILISTFSFDDDIVSKKFLKLFYHNIFHRRSIEESFAKAISKLQQKKENEHYLCCCLHEEKQNSLWPQIVHRIGRATAHKVFLHNNRLMLSKNLQHPQKLTRLILEMDNSQKVEVCKWTHPKKRNIKSVNACCPNLLEDESQPNFQQERQGGGKFKWFDYEKDHESRERNKFVYQLIQSLWKDDHFFTCISGSARQGKTNLLSLTKKYIKQRKTKNDLVFEDLEDYPINVENVINNMSKISKENKFAKKLLFYLGKLKENDEVFNKAMINIQKRIKDTRIKIVVTSQTEIFGQIQNLKVVKVPHLTKIQALEILMKEVHISFFTSQNHCQVLKNILQRNLKFRQILALRQTMDANTGKKINISKINEKLDSFSKREPEKLDELWKKDCQYFKFLSFLSQFQEGINICDFNESLFANMFKINNIRERLVRDVLKQLYEISYLKIIPHFERNINLFFKPNFETAQHLKSQKHDKKKINYFQNIYRKIRKIFKQLRKQSSKYKKYLNYEGIFQFQVYSQPMNFEFEIINQSAVVDVEKFLKKFLKYALLNLNQFLKYLNSKDVKKFDEQQKQNIPLFIIDALIVHHIICLSSQNEKQFKIQCEKLFFKLESRNYSYTILQIQFKVLMNNNQKFESSSKFQNRKMKDRFIKNILKYQIVQRKVRSLITQKVDHKQLEEIGLDIEQVQKKLQENINILSQNAHQNYWGITPVSIAYLLLKLVIQKTIIKFENNIQTSKSHYHKYFEFHCLEESLKKNEKMCQARSEQCRKQVELCHAYFQLQKDASLKMFASDFDKSEIIPEMFNLYNYITFKINPSILLKNQNVIGFMKARCLEVRKTPCSFIRKGHIIQNYLNSKLEGKNLSLFFLNLTMENFRKICQDNPTIYMLVLTIDAQKEGEGIKLIFENEFQGYEKIFDVKDFVTEIRKINFRFLILFGSLSHEVSSILAEALNDRHGSVIISFSSSKDLLLSNYPTQQQAEDLMEQYLFNENWQRSLEIIVCSLVTQIIQKGENPLTKQSLHDIIERCYKNREIILQKDYEQEMIFNLNYRTVILNQQQEPLLFPNIKEGKFMQLTETFNKIDHNFNNQSFYEVIGRNGEIIKTLSTIQKEKKCMVQISGGPRNGKTQILKQLGWFCQTRHIFGMGVYFYDMQEIRKINSSILEFLNLENHEKVRLRLQRTYKMDETKHCLLILLDNFNQSDIEENKDFFELVSKGPVSLIYTTVEKELNFENDTVVEFQCECEHDKKSKYGYRRWRRIYTELNKLNYRQIACIILSKTRHLQNKERKNVFNAVLSKRVSSLSDILSQISQELRGKKLENMKQINYLNYDYSQLTKLTESCHNKILIYLTRQ